MDRQLYDVRGELLRGASHRLGYRLAVGFQFHAHGAQEPVQVPHNLLVGQGGVLVAAEKLDRRDQIWLVLAI